MEPTETKTQEKPAASKQSALKKPWVQSIIGIVVAFGLLGLFFVIRGQLDTVKIDNSQILAPVITLSSTTGGTLNDMYVQNGDEVAANTPLALVGTEVITSKVAGVITDANQTTGATFAPGQTVVSMIEPSALRVVGQIQENKGLSRISVGQPVTFTVDAFGSKTYYGVVDSVSATSNASDVVFNISDEREEQNFDVKVRYDTTAYPELKNGMSAKIVVHIKE